MRFRAVVKRATTNPAGCQDFDYEVFEFHADQLDMGNEAEFDRVITAWDVDARGNLFMTAAIPKESLLYIRPYN